MQTLRSTTPASTVFALAFLGAAVTLTGQVFWSSATDTLAPKRGEALSSAATYAPGSAASHKPEASALAGITPAAPLRRLAAPPAKPVVSSATAEKLRARIRFETVLWQGKPMQTLDEASRLLLVRAAAEKAGLKHVGLGFHDVYGVIEAETSWIQRQGASKDGTPNLGLAQFEPRTAVAMGLENPEDPVQAVFAAAFYMKQGAKWAAGRIGTLKLSPEEYQAKLREGVSVHYNLSVKGRNKWNGLNAAELPIETQRHIRNVSSGVIEAAQLARQRST